MMDEPGEHPAPHAELASREPLLHTLVVGKIVYRIHSLAYNTIFFGRTGNYRYDAPDGSFGVMYAGDDLDCCFIESFGQTIGVPAVSGAYLEARGFAELEVRRDLRLVDLYETASLARIGADGRLLTGSYKVSQQWSAALRKHSCNPDGIRYRSRRDPAKVAYAIYDCPYGTFRVTERGSLMERKNRAELNRLLDLYKVDLIET